MKEETVLFFSKLCMNNVEFSRRRIIRHERILVTPSVKRDLHFYVYGSTKMRTFSTTKKLQNIRRRKKVRAISGNNWHAIQQRKIGVRQRKYTQWSLVLEINGPGHKAVRRMSLFVAGPPQYTIPFKTGFLSRMPRCVCLQDSIY